MKKKDLIIIIFVVIVSGIFSYILCSKFISPPTNRQQDVEVVEPITSDFQVADPTVFNVNAVNPTRLIQIGPNANNQPFVGQ
jgi:hypothetical protein